MRLFSFSLLVLKKQLPFFVATSQFDGQISLPVLLLFGQGAKTPSHYCFRSLHHVEHRCFLLPSACRSRSGYFRRDREGTGSPAPRDRTDRLGKHRFPRCA
ncbi:hypothetical protein AGR1A_Cc20848 [Agrobacterium fabacearum CFBP 5771]|nr:hypothetical protein AGR1C_Cc11078 [Agrobacterium fabacearum TT111]CVI16240.1 hypothetical protein AGR1A_Cc20848 [Agrobacterium fabacearum CFBP 5771]